MKKCKEQRRCSRWWLYISTNPLILISPLPHLSSEVCLLFATLALSLISHFQERLLLRMGSNEYTFIYLSELCLLFAFLTLSLNSQFQERILLLLGSILGHMCNRCISHLLFSSPVQTLRKIPATCQGHRILPLDISQGFFAINYMVIFLPCNI